MNTSPANQTITRLNEFADSVKTGGKLAQRYTTKHRDGTVTITNKGLPILKCVKVARHVQGVTVESTNLETHAIGQCWSNYGDEWAICIPFEPLNDWLKALPRDKAQELTMAMDSRTQILTVHYVNGITMAAEFKGIDAQEFPEGTKESA